MPVVRHFFEAKRFTNIHEIQDVFLKAGAAVTHRSLQELIP